jgi:integrase
MNKVIPSCCSNAVKMKVSFYLTRPDSDSETAIYARICYHGYKFKWYTTESIIPEFWNKKKQEAKKSSSFYDGPELNERLDQIRKDISKHFRQWVNDNNGVIPQPDTFRAVLDIELKKIEPKKEFSSSFLPYFAEMIDRTEKGIRLQPGSGKRYSKAIIASYKTVEGHLKEFAKSYKRKIDFKTIDQDFYEDYTVWLGKAKKLNINSIGKDIKTIKVVLNDATAKGINTNMAFKSRSFSAVSKDVDNVYLTVAELNEMYKLDLSGNIRLDKVRDMFLIACHTGLRYSDFSRLTADHFTDDGMIEIEQKKTGKRVLIPVHSVVSRIRQKYKNELPTPISNQKFNDYLKEVAKMVELLNVETKIPVNEPLKVSRFYQKWEKIAAHTARRSFATNEFLAGTSTLTIMAITGHTTEKSFLKYIKVTPKEHAVKMQSAWAERAGMKAVV